MLETTHVQVTIEMCWYMYLWVPRYEGSTDTFPAKKYWFRQAGIVQMVRMHTVPHTWTRFESLQRIYKYVNQNRLACNAAMEANYLFMMTNAPLKTEACH